MARNGRQASTLGLPPSRLRSSDLGGPRSLAPEASTPYPLNFTESVLVCLLPCLGAKDTVTLVVNLPDFVAFNVNFNVSWPVAVLETAFRPLPAIVSFPAAGTDTVTVNVRRLTE